MRKKCKGMVLWLVAILFALVLCGCTTAVTNKDPQIVYLAVDGITATEYTACDSLKIVGGKLFVLYDNNVTETVDLTKEMIDTSSFDMNIPGDQEVKVRYKDATTSFKIHIEEWKLTNIKLLTTPYITEYVVGQQIDLKGATLQLDFAKGENSTEEKHSTLEVTKDMLFEYDNYQLGKQTISLGYFDSVLTFEVNYIEKTPMTISVIDSADNNFVFVEKGQYKFVVYETGSGKPVNADGETVDGSTYYEYDSVIKATEASERFATENRKTYIVKMKNHFDMTGMTVQIGYDNNQMIMYGADTGESLSEGYKDSTTLPSELFVGIDDSLEGTVEAILLYQPQNYSEEFIYYYYGTSYVKEGELVMPEEELASNQLVRNGETIVLDAIQSRSYGMVTKVQENSDGSGIIVVSRYARYSLTSVAVKVGQIIANESYMGLYGTTAVYSIGGGIVEKVYEDGTVIVKTAPTTQFISKVQSRSFASIEIVDVNDILPERYPDKTTINDMIQGDTVDLTTGSVLVTYDDGSSQTFGLNSAMINVVNAGVASVNEGLNIAEAKSYELWIVYGGIVEQHTSLFITVKSRYPIALFIEEETNSISGNRFYVGDKINISSMRYYIRYNNETTGEERQLTEDMVGDGMSLYCTASSDNKAYETSIFFQLPKSETSVLPEGIDQIYSEKFKYTVVPQTLVGDFNQLTAPTKVYVTDADSIDLTGALYSVMYRNNTVVKVKGSEIMDCKGTGYILDNGCSIDITYDNTRITKLYIDEDCKLHAQNDLTDAQVAENGWTEIGTRKVAVLRYRDMCYADYKLDIESGEPKYYRVGDVYEVGTEFYYYLITDPNWVVSDIKAILETSAGIKMYKDEYAQYEDWNMAGVYIDITTPNGIRRINATTDMIFDSSTQELTDSTFVKFYFLGASDETTLEIKVIPRVETKLSMDTQGTSYYLTGRTLDLSSYYFKIAYNAGPEEPIRGLTGVKNGKTQDGWWYSLHQKYYVIRNEKNEIIEVNSEGAKVSNFVTYASAEQGMKTALLSNPEGVYRIEWIRSEKSLGILSSNSGEIEVVVDLHHTVAKLETDISTTFFVTVSSATMNTEAITFVGSKEKLSEEVSGTKETGNGYAVLDRYGRTSVMTVEKGDAKVIGYVSSDNIFVLDNKYTIYYDSEKEAQEALEVLLDYSVIGPLSGVYYIVNGYKENNNNIRVAMDGSVSDTTFSTTSKATADLVCSDLIESEHKAYYVSYDGYAKKYILTDATGNRFVLSNGRKVIYYFNTAQEAEGYKDQANGVCYDVSSAVYYVYREERYLTSSGSLSENINSRITFTTKEEAENFLKIGHISQETETQTNVGSASTEVKRYYITQNGYYLNTDGSQIVSGIFNEVKLYFSEEEDAQAYLATNRLDRVYDDIYYYAYSVSNTYYVMSEIVAGSDLMLYKKTSQTLSNGSSIDVFELPYIYAFSSDGKYEKVPVTNEMVSYEKNETSTGYIKTKINYNNNFCYVYLYATKASLVSVAINKDNQPMSQYIKGAVLNTDDGFLELTYARIKNNKVVEGNPLYAYLPMNNESVSYSGFRSDIYSKDGTPITVNVEFGGLKTSYNVTIFDLQDIQFDFSNTIFFYGNVTGASYSVQKKISEFTLPRSSCIEMKYVESKYLVPVKQLVRQEGHTYYPVTVYDAEGNLAVLYYIDGLNFMKFDYGANNPYDPASGVFYVEYASFVLRDSAGILERLTASEYASPENHVIQQIEKEEYDNLTDREKSLYTKRILYYQKLEGGDVVETKSVADFKKLIAGQDKYTPVFEYVMLEDTYRNNCEGNIMYVYSAEQYQGLSSRMKGLLKHIKYLYFDENKLKKVLTEEEFFVLTDAEKENNCFSVDLYVLGKDLYQTATQGDVLYKYTTEEYNKLTSDKRIDCYEVSNSYYLMIIVNDDENIYYENANYCLQEYTILPKIIDVSVADPDKNAYLLRIETGNNPKAVSSLYSNITKWRSNILGSKFAEDKNYSAYIQDIRLLSPNKDYFEIAVYPNNDMLNDVDLEQAVSEVYLLMIKNLIIENISNFKLSGDDLPVEDEARKNVIKGKMVQGINIFNDMKSDDDYTISYVVNSGETLKRKNILQLLSGKLAFAYNKTTKEFNVVVGSLGHDSYTIDLKVTSNDLKNFTLPTTDATVKTKDITVKILNYNERVLLFRIFMSNANEVYSLLIDQKDYERIEKESKEKYAEFLEDLLLLSPNNEYLEFGFKLMNDWEGTESQENNLTKLSYEILTLVTRLGAEQVYIGEDIHVYVEGTTLNGIYVDFEVGGDNWAETSSFTKVLRFTSKETEISAVMNKFKHLIVDDGEFFNESVQDFMKLEAGKEDGAKQTKYSLKVNLIDHWKGSSTQVTALANAVYDLLTAISGYGTLYYNEENIDDLDIAYFEEVVSVTPNLSDNLFIRINFSFVSGSMYDFVYNDYDDLLYEITDNNAYEGVTKFSVHTLEAITCLLFVSDPQSEPSTDTGKIKLLLSSTLEMIQTELKTGKIYYGNTIRKYNEKDFSTVMTKEAIALLISEVKDIGNEFLTSVEVVQTADRNYNVYLYVDDSLLFYSSEMMEIKEKVLTSFPFHMSVNIYINGGNKVYNDTDPIDIETTLTSGEKIERIFSFTSSQKSISEVLRLYQNAIKTYDNRDAVSVNFVNKYGKVDGNYILRANVDSSWNNTENDINALANKIYQFLSALSEDGVVLFEGNGLNKNTFIDYVGVKAIFCKSNKYLDIPFSFDGNLYMSIRDNVGLDFDGFEIRTPTSSTQMYYMFTFDGRGREAYNLVDITENFMREFVKLVFDEDVFCATCLNYGKQVYAQKQNFIRASLTKQNVFGYNESNYIWDISYIVEDVEKKSPFLSFDDVYRLLGQKLAVNPDLSDDEGEISVTFLSLWDGEIFYTITSEGETAESKIKVEK